MSQMFLKMCKSLVLQDEITYRRLGCLLPDIVSRVSYCVRRRGEGRWLVGTGGEQGSGYWGERSYLWYFTAALYFIVFHRTPYYHYYDHADEHNDQ